MTNTTHTWTARDPLLSVDNLHTHFFTDEGTVRAVDGVSFDVFEGEIVGLVGESGAGKSVATSSIMRLIDPPGRIVGGEVTYKDDTLVRFDEGPDGTIERHDEMLTDEEMRTRIRGREIATIFQDPMASLNPVLTVGSQIQEFIELNRDLPPKDARDTAIEMLREVGIPRPSDRFDNYPHEFSGGMRQRVLIAMALACEPNLIIADEPTTALDVTVEGQILNLVKDLQRRYDTSFLWVTHDLAVIADICDRVNVMYLGEIVERAEVDDLFYDTKQPYTQALLNSVPRPDRTADSLTPITGVMPEAIDPPSGCRFHTRCPDAHAVCANAHPELTVVDDETDHEAACVKYDAFAAEYERQSADRAGDADGGIRRPTKGRQRLAMSNGNDTQSSDETLVRVDGLRKHFSAGNGLLDGLRVDLGGGFPVTYDPETVQAVDDVSFEIRRGETLGLVGESGCGKSTLGRTILRLIDSSGGAVYFKGENVVELSREALRATRRDQQIVFQDPQSSLNPRMKVGSIVEEPMKAHGLYDEAGREARARELLETVGLDPQHYDRYPHQFSGGQRQRINLARALSVEPEFIVCDEPTSALDASIQAQVLNTMKELQDEFDLTYLFISHDLSVIRHIADRVAVMYLGKLVEIADKDELFRDPKHPYTRALLTSIPVPDPRSSGTRNVLEGDVPSPIDPPSGCRFRTRCPSLIAPEEHGLDEPTWNRVRAFVRAVKRRTFDPTDGTDVRQRFFADVTVPGDAGTVVDDAIDLIRTEKWEAATGLLEKRFIEPSICAREAPAYTVESDDGDEMFVSCHRYR